MRKSSRHEPDAPWPRSDAGPLSNRRQRREVERGLTELSPRPRAPLVLENVRRAGELVGDLGHLWRHEGVTPERRRELVEEVFERIELDWSGIRTVLPRPQYRPL